MSLTCLCLNLLTPKTDEVDTDDTGTLRLNYKFLLHPTISNKSQLTPHFFLLQSNLLEKKNKTDKKDFLTHTYECPICGFSIFIFYLMKITNEWRKETNVENMHGLKMFT